MQSKKSSKPSKSKQPYKVTLKHFPQYFFAEEMYFTSAYSSKQAMFQIYKREQFVRHIIDNNLGYMDSSLIPLVDKYVETEGLDSLTDELHDELHYEVIYEDMRRHEEEIGGQGV
jgi:hypothetical protein